MRIFASSVALVALLGAGSLVTGCASSASDSSVAGDDSESALSNGLKVGTYELVGSRSQFFLKRLVIKDGSSYEAQMYPASSFPDDSIQDTTGKYSSSSGKLTLKFPSGGVWDTFDVESSGATVKFHSHENDVDFTMKFSGSDTSAPTDSTGTDPGTPPAVSGGTALSCTGRSDLRANIEIKSSGSGSMYVSGSSSLGIRSVSKVKLSESSDEPSDDSWVRSEGSSSGTLYRINFPTSLFSSTRSSITLSLSVSTDAEHMEESPWDLDCSVSR